MTPRRIKSSNRLRLNTRQLTLLVHLEEEPRQLRGRLDDQRPGQHGIVWKMIVQDFVAQRHALHARCALDADRQLRPDAWLARRRRDGHVGDDEQHRQFARVPFEERELLSVGLGITNLVARATASAGELSPDELIRGASRLVAKVRRRRPAVVAFLGLEAYRTALARPAVVVGPQPETIGDANVWVLPNPSGLNARYQLPALARRFSELRRAAFRSRGG